MYTRDIAILFWLSRTTAAPWSRQSSPDRCNTATARAAWDGGGVDGVGAPSAGTPKGRCRWRPGRPIDRPAVQWERAPRYRSPRPLRHTRRGRRLDFLRRRVVHNIVYEPRCGRARTGTRKRRRRCRHSPAPRPTVLSTFESRKAAADVTRDACTRPSTSPQPHHNITMMRCPLHITHASCNCMLLRHMSMRVYNNTCIPHKLL